MSLFKKMLSGMAAQKQEDRKAKLYRDLIRHEARIGGELFGPVPKGGSREFFCLDEHTWVWHEEWVGKDRKRHTKTTRYDVRPDGILKAQDGQLYQKVNPAEAQHLREAAELYYKRVKNEIYPMV